MKSAVNFLILVMAFSATIACNSHHQDSQNSDMDSIEKMSDFARIDSLIPVANATRDRIQPILKDLYIESVTYDQLPADLKQKLSKVSYYYMDGNLVAVESFAIQDSQMEREIFFMKDSHLILAEVPRKPAYYFNNGKPVFERSVTRQKRYPELKVEADTLAAHFRQYRSLLKK